MALEKLAYTIVVVLPPSNAILFEYVFVTHSLTRAIEISNQFVRNYSREMGMTMTYTLYKFDMPTFLCESFVIQRKYYTNRYPHRAVRFVELRSADGN